MNAWPDSYAPQETNVYLGVWTNWSYGKILGATLTTTRENGNLLLAFTAFFVAFVANRFWIIFCLVLHKSCSTHRAQDALYHQRQVILRNSTSPEAGLLSLVRLMWAWRCAARRRISRILPPILLALACIVAFTFAGGFSSRIQVSSTGGDEVLIRSDRCGMFVQPTDPNFQITANALAAERLSNSANYAQQCYSTNSSGMLDCNKFVVSKLPAVVNTTADCPFDDVMCRTLGANIRLDTGYLDLNNHFGLDSPPDQRASVRYVLHCAPLVTEGYKDTGFMGDNETFVRYYYGESTGVENNTVVKVNFTEEFFDVPVQYRTQKFTLANFQVKPLLSSTINGKPDSSGDFTPRPELARSDGDVQIIFLSGNGVRYDRQMNDEWYRASVDFGSIFFQTEQKTGVYIPDEAASPLGCVEQYQWCNTAFPTDASCGPLASFSDATAKAAPLFGVAEETLDADRPSSSSEAGTRLIWPAMVLAHYPFEIRNLIMHLGPQSLQSQARFFDGVQGSLPDNQWQLDVTYWFATILAGMQASFVDTALGASYGAVAGSFLPPVNSYEENLCTQQKMRSASHASFSLFGLYFTFGLGMLVLAISYGLGPALGYYYKRYPSQNYAHVEWIANETLQLHRLAYDERGLGNWSQCTKYIPITKPYQLLGRLDITDANHPVIYRATGETTRDNTGAADNHEKYQKETVTSPKSGSVSTYDGSQMLYSVKSLGQTTIGGSEDDFPGPTLLKMCSVETSQDNPHLQPKNLAEHTERDRYSAIRNTTEDSIVPTPIAAVNPASINRSSTPQSLVEFPFKP